MGRVIPGRPGLLSGVGQPAAQPPASDLSVGAYATASLLGAAAGGSLVGFLASADKEGALTGGLFTTGLAALSDAFLFTREGQPGAAFPMVAVGLAGLGWSLFRFASALQAAVEETSRAPRFRAA